MKSKYIRKIIALCCLSIMSLGICNNSQAVFYPFVADDLNILRGSFQMFSTIYSMATAVTTIFVARITNEKTIRPIITIAVITGSASIILFAFSSQLWQFYVLGFIRGIAMAFTGVVLFTNVVNGWFNEKQGLICSIVMAVAGLAGAVFSPLYSFIINNYGWRIAYIVMGLMFLGFGTVGIIEPLSLKAESLNEVPYGKESEQQNKSHANKEFSYKDPVFWLMAIFCFCASIAISMGSNMPGYTESIGLGREVGVTIISCIMISNVLGKIINGILTDKISGFFSNMLMIIITFLSVIGFIIFKEPTIMIVIGLFYGFIYSFTAMGMGFVAREFFGDNNYNKTFPIFSFACNLGGALAVSLIGYLYDFTHSYRPAFYVGALLLGFGIIILFYGRKKKLTGK